MIVVVPVVVRVNKNAATAAVLVLQTLYLRPLVLQPVVNRRYHNE